MNIEMREMTIHEIEITEGGGWLIFAGGIVTAVGGYLAKGVIDNWTDFKKGFAQGYNTFV